MSTSIVMVVVVTVVVVVPVVVMAVVVTAIGVDNDDSGATTSSAATHVAHHHRLHHHHIHHHHAGHHRATSTHTLSRRRVVVAVTLCGVGIRLLVNNSCGGGGAWLLGRYRDRVAVCIHHWGHLG